MSGPSWLGFLAAVVVVWGLLLLRLVYMALAALMVFSGLFWALQGLGIIMWPASSFMLQDIQWTWNGLFVVLGGIACIYFARRG